MKVLAEKRLTYSQEGLVVADVLGGEWGAHAEGEGRQGKAREEARQQELQQHLLLLWGL